MQTTNLFSITVDSHIIASKFLQRDVTIDIYIPKSGSALPQQCSLLLINDGQDLVTMDFHQILSELFAAGKITPLICVGIHCGPDRKNEYGVAGVPDYKGRGAKASLYTRFVFEELLPFIRAHYEVYSFVEKAFCGFSLGGLSALDIVWKHPSEFSRVGVFSGSLWWRSVCQNDPEFDESRHRIMHQVIQQGEYAPWLKFFFATGTLDETADRNNNGIIDSIDDTLALIADLEAKGYDPHKDIDYLELSDGRHDVATWARTFPEFLIWGWGK